MKVVGAVVRSEGICLSVGVQLCVLDAVADTADGLAEKRGVVLLVEFLSWEALNNVLVVLADEELLDDSSEREESEGCWRRHGGGVMSKMRAYIAI